MATIRETHVPTVRRATIADREEVARSLASALADDPFVRWSVGNVRDPERRSLPVFRAMTRHELAKGEHLVYVDDDRRSIAVWKGIDQWKGTVRELLRSLPATIRSGRWRMPRALRAFAMAEKVHPEDPHYYLAMLGTRADQQGKGLGSAVITPMLERCDGEGVLAYLESSNPRNEPFYVRHGFVRLGEIPVPKGCPPVVAMSRDPR